MSLLHIGHYDKYHESKFYKINNRVNFQTLKRTGLFSFFFSVGIF